MRLAGRGYSPEDGDKVLIVENSWLAAAFYLLTAPTAASTATASTAAAPTAAAPATVATAAIVTSPADKRT